MITFALLFICVVGVSVVLFGFWVGISILKLIWRLVNGGSNQAAVNSSGRPCMNPGCRTGNPVHARFCRRCGSNLAQAGTLPPNNWRMDARYDSRTGRPGNPAANGRGRQMEKV